MSSAVVDAVSHTVFLKHYLLLYHLEEVFPEEDKIVDKAHYNGYPHCPAAKNEHHGKINRIQNCQPLDFDEDDDISGHYNLGSENLDYVSDFDRDGERTIFDATAIQMKLAEIEEKPKYNEDLVYSALNNMDPNDVKNIIWI